MKIVCLTAVHQRREITGIFYQAFADQRIRALKEGIDLSLQVVASDAEDIALANYYGHAPAEAPNLPLGAKLGGPSLTAILTTACVLCA